MKDVDIYEVVKKLIGEVDPVGETREDQRRARNLEELGGLTIQLIRDLHIVEYMKGRAGRAAGGYLSEIREGIAPKEN